jgi:hypothetical protein
MLLAVDMLFHERMDAEEDGVDCNGLFALDLPSY